MRRRFTRISALFPAIRNCVKFEHTSSYFNQHIQFPTRNATTFTSTHLLKPSRYMVPINNFSITRPFSTNSDQECSSDTEYEFERHADGEKLGDFKGVTNLDSLDDLETIMAILRAGGVQEKSKNLEKCGVMVTPAIVSNVLSRVRNDWETAFTFFLWAGKQPDYAHSIREYHSMISILGKFRKFDTASALINDMRAASLLTPQTLLIMIRKYAAVHDVGKAISTFYALRRFKFEIGMEEFQGLLSALCRYKNVKDAEHLLFCNKSSFPLNTKSFNIILNGWCNVVGDLREGKRIWREMEERGIMRDVYSYASIMSSYSKAGNLNAVFRHFDQMKALEIEPDRKVYNAVIHAFAKGRLVKEARILMKTMEEKGINPDTITYNSLIKPLCKARLFDEAKEVFNELIERGLSPSTRTYHAFFRILRTGEEVFQLLDRMHMECHPSHDTYIMLIRKFCRWRQLDNVIKLWTEMSKNGLDPDRSSYIVLIHGLFLNGKLEEAYKYYLEMKEKHLLTEPKIDEMLQAWLQAKADSGHHATESTHSQSNCSQLGPKDRVKSKTYDRNIDFRRQPETKSITRERGFSFCDS
ncbi:pentatricopeptide repeat-containing protein At5g15010, mitochondrial [Olea europaea var. sylvestris]|uniref:pentatricopeptide repeat-containing protein At5g15010, mitochondrial n=1 Tax=Olea europaea var. sylvestris TaxID=158386 RepID=UPI000C1D837B|nr:pentatricopeptide repeat-containing protein At5g15010, mitochondrial [Olea europaea var. sylvestris]